MRELLYVSVEIVAKVVLDFPRCDNNGLPRHKGEETAKERGAYYQSGVFDELPGRWLPFQLVDSAPDDERNKNREDVGQKHSEKSQVESFLVFLQIRRQSQQMFHISADNCESSVFMKSLRDDHLSFGSLIVFEQGDHESGRREA